MGNAGEYTLILDNGSCRDTTRKFINVLPTPTVNLQDQIISTFCEAPILDPKINGSATLQYSWTPAEDVSCSDCPTTGVTNAKHVKYALKVSNEFTCQDSGSIEVLLDTENLLYLPNTFSPHLPGDNDHFQLFPNCGVALIRKLDVFDRYGGLVFSLENIDQLADKQTYWDGKIDGRMASAGIYPWQMEIELINGTQKTLTGHVTILP